LLYHLLTGKRPFPGRSEQEMTEAIRAAEPMPLRSLAPCVHRTLEAICGKCLEKDPLHRLA
jgi:serine/threonine-protein kinase